MTDVEVARDSVGPTSSLLTRWLLKMSKGNYHCTDEDMMAVCWELVDIAMTLQIFGPAALEMREPDLIQGIQGSSSTRFNERITAMCKVMTGSKARCISLMQDELGVFVANIVQIERARDSNLKNNSKRNKVKAELNLLKGVASMQVRKGRPKTARATKRTTFLASDHAENDDEAKGDLMYKPDHDGEQIHTEVKMKVKDLTRSSLLAKAPQIHPTSVSFNVDDATGDNLLETTLPVGRAV